MRNLCSSVKREFSVFEYLNVSSNSEVNSSGDMTIDNLVCLSDFLNIRVISSSNINARTLRTQHTA